MTYIDKKLYPVEQKNELGILAMCTPTQKEGAC